MPSESGAKGKAQMQLVARGSSICTSRLSFGQTSNPAGSDIGSRGARAEPALSQDTSTKMPPVVESLMSDVDIWKQTVIAGLKNAGGRKEDQLAVLLEQTKLVEMVALAQLKDVIYDLSESVAWEFASSEVRPGLLPLGRTRSFQLVRILELGIAVC
jgi:hypothetical protein